MKKGLATILGFTFGIAAFSGALPAAAGQGDEVRAAIQKAGLEMLEEEMQGMYYASTNVSKRGSGPQAWIPLKRCKGSLVIRLDTFKRYAGMYTTGDCSMADLKAR